MPDHPQSVSKRSKVTFIEAKEQSANSSYLSSPCLDSSTENRFLNGKIFYTLFICLLLRLSLLGVYFCLFFCVFYFIRIAY